MYNLSSWRYEFKQPQTLIYFSAQEIYSISYGNEGASSSVSDMDDYVMITKLLDSTSNPRPIFVRRWEIQIYLHRFSFS
jgi:hypothetical protein